MSDAKTILKEHYQRIGAKGGKARAKRHSHKQMSEWASQGEHLSETRKKEVIRALTKRQGKRSQAELAKDIGVCQAWISRVMHGKVPPGKKILRYLGMDEQANAA